MITPQSSGEETGISWAGDNDYFFVKGKEQTLNRLKELGLYDKVHYLVNAYGQYEAQTNLVKESLSMAIISAIITIIVISFFYILLHVLYFTHFRRTIVIKLIRKGEIVETGTLDDLRHLTRYQYKVETEQEAVGLKELSSVHDLQIKENEATFQADSDAIDEILKTLLLYGVKKLEATPPTLEDLFMRHYQ